MTRAAHRRQRRETIIATTAFLVIAWLIGSQGYFALRYPRDPLTFENWLRALAWMEPHD